MGGGCDGEGETTMWWWLWLFGIFGGDGGGTVRYCNALVRFLSACK
jgi:hypothetical protein